ncbi:MAG: hypothetical protein ACR2LX_10100 [Jatrophihabitans sp.]
MRGYAKVLTVVAAAALTATTAACTSSPGGSDTKSVSGKKPAGAFSTLTGITTTVVFDPGFVAALGTLKLTPTPFGTAKIKKVGTNTEAVFPITGGKATVYAKGDVTPYVQGEVDHDGSGLTLTAGPASSPTKVTIMNFAIHPGTNSTLTGDVAIDGGTPLHSVKLFDLDGGTLKTPTISKAGVVTLQGTTIYLSTEAANALNGVFKTNALAGGKKVKVGTAIIMATGK